MDVIDKGIGALSDALMAQGFRAVDEFDLFVTFAHDDDPLKIHVGPDGSFAVFDDRDELLTEGDGAEDLYRMLGKKAVLVGRRLR